MRQSRLRGLLELLKEQAEVPSRSRSGSRGLKSAGMRWASWSQRLARAACSSSCMLLLPCFATRWACPASFRIRFSKASSMECARGLRDGVRVTSALTCRLQLMTHTVHFARRKQQIIVMQMQGWPKKLRLAALHHPNVHSFPRGCSLHSNQFHPSKCRCILLQTLPSSAQQHQHWS